jgi:deazaflavin-dependent oxidoreductase (nitroreductase family)
VSVWKTGLPVGLYRLTRGRVFGRVGGHPVLLLQSTGRRTGRARTTPVQYLREGEKFVVVASNAGAPHPPAWLLNLRAYPRARVQLGSESVDVIAREAVGDEPRALWRRLTADNRLLDKAARTAGRPLPVVVLTPARRTGEEAGG